MFGTIGRALVERMRMLTARWRATTASELTAQSEHRVRSVIGAKLADWASVANELQQIKWDLLRDPPSGTEPQRLAVMVCARLNNQLRSAMLLTERGYALEAFSVVASMAELAYTLGYIGANAEEASKWAKFESESKPFVGVWKALRATVLHTGGTVASAQAEYRHYQYLCMAKHGNPKVFRSFGFSKSSGGVAVYHGPYASREVLYLSRVALWYACHYMWLGLMVYRDFHTVEWMREARHDDLARCFQGINRIRSEDVALYEADFPREA
jgi:hypothetical protein